MSRRPNQPIPQLPPPPRVLDHDFGREAALAELPTLGKSGLPVVCLPSRSITLADTDEMLAKAAKKGLYRRGSVLTQQWDGRLETMSPADLSHWIQNHSLPVKWLKVSTKADAEKWALALSVDVPADLAKRLLAGPKTREAVPEVGIVSPVPVLLPNGRILSSGYDANSKTLVTWKGGSLPTVSRMEAVRRLDDLLCDFQFVTPADKSRALANLLSPAAIFGGLLARGPATLSEASDSSTGKGYLLRAITEVYGQTYTAIAQSEGGVGSLDESIKSALLAGRPFIGLDNLRGELRSTFFESLMTEDEIICRTPYREGVPVDPRRFIILLTSNGVTLTRDAANRASPIRLRKRESDYGWRDWPEGRGKLIEHIAANRSLYLSCIFLCWREWIDLKRPVADTAWSGHHREWWRTMDALIPYLWPQLPPPTEGLLETTTRLGNPTLMFVREIALLLARRGQHCPDGYRAGHLADLAQEHGISFPGIDLDRMPEDRRNRLLGSRLAALFSPGENSVVVDEWRVTRVERWDKDACDGQGRQCRFYVFESTHAA